MYEERWRISNEMHLLQQSLQFAVWMCATYVSRTLHKLNSYTDKLNS